MHHLKIVEQINDTFIDYADVINIAMPMYNLLSMVIIILILQKVYGILKEMK